MLIGLAGDMGSGKSTVASYLGSKGFRCVKFASTLKAMLASMLLSAGLDADTIARMIEGDLKEVPADVLYGKTPRHAMQTLGTEWGRDCLGDGVWGKIWEKGVKKELEDGRSVVTDDMRFANEQRRVVSLGGYIVLIKGRGLVNSHASENKDHIVPDFVIDNSGAIENLYAQVDEVIGKIQQDVWQ